MTRLGTEDYPLQATNCVLHDAPCISVLCAAGNFADSRVTFPLFFFSSAWEVVAVGREEQGKTLGEGRGFAISHHHQPGWRSIIVRVEWASQSVLLVVLLHADRL